MLSPVSSIFQPNCKFAHFILRVFFTVFSLWTIPVSLHRKIPMSKNQKSWQFKSSDISRSHYFRQSLKLRVKLYPILRPFWLKGRGGKTGIPLGGHPTLLAPQIAAAAR